MKRNLFFYLYVCTCLGLISCSENLVDNPIINEVNQEEYVTSLAVSSMDRFSEILSKAVKENLNLRSFLKEKALEMIDNDYDIFYPRSKNEIVADGKSFRDILVGYAASEEELMGIETQIPLLTIYIPELPSGFNANTWNTENEIPLIANTILKNDSTSFFYNGEIAGLIESNAIPGCPTLVIKNNERIQLKDKMIPTTLLKSTPYEDAYEFIDEAFNGLNNQSVSLRAATLPVSQLSPVVIAAYNEMGSSSSTYWQRDYVYYGMTKQTGSTGYGYFETRFSEKIVSIKFSDQAYNTMADQSDDALMTPRNAIEISVIKQSKPNYSISDCLWTEGRFEIKIDLIKGNGATSSKLFNVLPQELFDVQYEIIPGFGALAPLLTKYVPKKAIGKEYNPNIDLGQWNLENDGYKWQFIISERDAQETITRSGTITTEFATNFGMTANGLGKIGLNFGASAKRTQSTTYSVVTSNVSDDLGSVEVYFSDPVIKSVSGNNYTLFSRSNPYVEITTIPTQMY